MTGPKPSRAQFLAALTVTGLFWLSVGSIALAYLVGEKLR
jgi:hypothetical protein